MCFWGHKWKVIKTEILKSQFDQLRDKNWSPKYVYPGLLVRTIITTYKCINCDEEKVDIQKEKE